MIWVSTAWPNTRYLKPLGLTCFDRIQQFTQLMFRQPYASKSMASPETNDSFAIVCLFEFGLETKTSTLLFRPVLTPAVVTSIAMSSSP